VVLRLSIIVGHVLRHLPEVLHGEILIDIEYQAARSNNKNYEGAANVSRSAAEYLLLDCLQANKRLLAHYIPEYYAVQIPQDGPFSLVLGPHPQLPCDPSPLPSPSRSPDFSARDFRGPAKQPTTVGAKRSSLP
jgi:hypothetical protein